MISSILKLLHLTIFGLCAPLGCNIYAILCFLHYTGLLLHHVNLFSLPTSFVCFNVMFVHGYVPVEATQTVICPTVKDKNGDLSDISNYRPIALATIFFKNFGTCSLESFT